MARWFSKKKKLEVKQPPVLSYNHEILNKRLEVGWAGLYETKADKSWQILMGQFQTIKNIHILAMHELNADDMTTTKFAELKGRISSFDLIQKTVEREFGKIDKARETKDQDAGYGTKIVHKKKRRARPAI